MGFAWSMKIYYYTCMLPWENTKPLTFICQYCKQPFKAKRNAKFCSNLCQSRNRPKRPTISTERRKELRLKRLEKPGYRERVNFLANENNRRVRYWLSVYKMSFGCTDCGYKKHHAALDFDHVRGEKKINVCNATSIIQAKREIPKCEIVCSNCHRIRTFNRLQKLKV